MSFPMTPQSSTKTIEPNLVGRATQIVAGALMVGIITFGGVVAFLTLQGEQGLAVVPGLLTYLAVGIFAVMIVVSIALPQVTVAQAIRKIAADKPGDWRKALVPVFLSKTVLSKAVLEGAAFCNLVVFLLERHWMTIAVVIVILMLMAVTFPSQTQFESWAEQVQRDHS